MAVARRGGAASRRRAWRRHPKSRKALPESPRGCAKCQTPGRCETGRVRFEELSTFADEAPRKRFDALLANALQDPECPLFLISTVRADFLDRLEHLPRLQGIYNNCKRNFLPTISEHGLREIIEGPARLARLDVSEVSAAILADARDEIGALPLVGNALFTLWQNCEDDRLSGERYPQEHGIAGMLSAQADDLLEQIDRTVPKGKLNSGYAKWV